MGIRFTEKGKEREIWILFERNYDSLKRENNNFIV